MMLDAEIQRLPHRDPFLFLSRVETLVHAERGVGVWSVRGDEPFFQGHFPDEPVVPGVLMTEALAQLAGLVTLPGEAKGGMLAQVNVKLQSVVRPPADIRLEATVTRSIGRLWLFDVRAAVGDTTVASGRIALAVGGPSEELP